MLLLSLRLLNDDILSGLPIKHFVDNIIRVLEKSCGLLWGPSVALVKFKGS